ncbi:hypothetical protein GC163_12260 [bacterium]|nr:hypothetical protein [bacterium]
MRCYWLIAVLMLSGCASIRDAVLQDKLYLRNSKEAAHAWREFCDIRTSGNDDWATEHYKIGFRDGYVGVAMGANGCPPTLPPKRYWKPEFRTPQGKVCVTDWYNGYAEGAQSAKSAGAPERNRVLTAVDVYGVGTSSNTPLAPVPMPAIPPAPHMEPPGIDPTLTPFPGANQRELRSPAPLPGSISFGLSAAQ